MSGKGSINSQDSSTTDTHVFDLLIFEGKLWSRSPICSLLNFSCKDNAYTKSSSILSLSLSSNRSSGSHLNDCDESEVEIKDGAAQTLDTRPPKHFGGLALTRFHSGGLRRDKREFIHMQGGRWEPHYHAMIGVTRINKQLLSVNKSQWRAPSLCLPLLFDSCRFMALVLENLWYPG